MNIPPSLIAAGKLVGVVAGILTAWFAIQDQLESTIQENTAVIVGAHISDLRTRVILQELEIEEHETAGSTVPGHMRLNKQLLEKQIEELTEWGE